MAAKKKTSSSGWVALLVLALGMLVLWLATADDAFFKQASTWQRLAEPGDLSSAHASLEDQCDACHTPLVGLETSKCIACHANDRDLLQRQPTSFHASIGNCSICHLEHLGFAHRLTAMDHQALARMGLRMLDDRDPDSEGRALRLFLLDRVEHGATPRAQLAPLEAILDCASCHLNDDRHFALFGKDCAQCHGTGRWTIAEFRHPSSGSRDCAQCHQAPPSHYMMHFKMISAGVARKPHARLEQCYECHQSTAWIDIKTVGIYKHH